MERLTEPNCYCFMTCCEQEGDMWGENCPIYETCCDRQIHDKLAHYEDLEEQGRLMELPCKVGSKTYCILSYYNYEKKESEYKIDECSFEVYMSDEWGEWFFSTKEEAEEKLKELKEGAE